MEMEMARRAPSGQKGPSAWMGADDIEAVSISKASAVSHFPMSCSSLPAKARNWDMSLDIFRGYILGNRNVRQDLTPAEMRWPPLPAWGEGARAYGRVPQPGPE